MEGKWERKEGGDRGQLPHLGHSNWQLHAGPGERRQRDAQSGVKHLILGLAEGKDTFRWLSAHQGGCSVLVNVALKGALGSSVGEFEGCKKSNARY